jgi:hypothetical protein
VAGAAGVVGRVWRRIWSAASARAASCASRKDLITPDTPLPILQRIGIAREKQRKPRDFDRVGPAHQLTRDKDDFFAQVDDDTLDRFEAVFKKLTV